MMNRIRRIAQGVVAAFCLWTFVPAEASPGPAGDFNPSNPPEPAVMYVVTVAVDPADVASPYGGGKYKKGASVYVRSSVTDSQYEFEHWTLNGRRYTTSSSFYYTVGDSTANFVAHYTKRPFNPNNPSEPQYITPSYPLHLVATPEGCCTFNRTSGSKADVDASVFLRAYGRENFTFNGWYCRGTLISSSESFYYVMGNKAETLTASYTYNPANPGEPDSAVTQPEVDNGQNGVKGDVNGDGVINTNDALLLSKLYIQGDPEGQLTLAVCDMNDDGVINTADAVAIMQWYLLHK